MKKLTAGIFSVLMGLVSVNAAEAAVASKGYVDAKIGDTDGKTVVEMIDSVSSGSSEATEALAGRVDTVEGAIDTLNGAETEEGSVAKKIADAIAGQDLTNKFAAKQDVANITQDIDTDKGSGVKYPSAKAVAEFVDDQIADVTGGVATQLSGFEGQLDTLTTLVNNNKTEADTGIQEAKDAAASALTDAKTYAEEKASAAQTAAETTAAADATTKANAAQAAAEATAAADATAKADAAQAAAEATAAADATAKANAAQAAAEATAAADATAKANAAQAAAEATAAADATTKANAAQAAAEATAATKISNLNLEALSRVPVDCQDPDSFCVLTAKGGQFYWEAIERATGEKQPEGTAIPAVK